MHALGIRTEFPRSERRNHLAPEDWDPDLSDLGSELRQSLGDEFRREAEEVERLIELQRLRRRDLGEAAAEVMARGDLVTVEVAGRSFTGRIMAARGDLLTVVTSDEDVDVHLGGRAVLRVVERRRRGGVEPPSGSRSFRARMAEYEQTGEPLMLLLSGGPLSGRIRVVGSDHAVVQDESGHDCYVPLGAIEAVVRVSPRRPEPGGP